MGWNLLVSKHDSHGIACFHPTKSSIYKGHCDQSPHFLDRWNTTNIHIRRGYRPRLGSFRACLQSIVYLHNEFVNIWSHLVPTLVYLAVLLTVDHSALYDGIDMSAADNAVMNTYITGFILGLIFSVCRRRPEAMEKAAILTPSQAYFHIVTAHDKPVAKRCLKLEYPGILLSVVTSAITFIYAGCYDEPSLQALYILLTALCATAVLFLIMNTLADGQQAAIWR